MFSVYPEVLSMDATYKLNDFRMPLYVLFTIDGSGESEIVGLWMVESEGKSNLGFALDSFKSHNANWEKLRCVMTDKDITERHII